MTTTTSGKMNQDEFNRAIETLQGSPKGRLALVEMAIKFGIATDKQRLAFLFFTNPDFAREVSDKVWAASQKLAAA